MFLFSIQILTSSTFQLHIPIHSLWQFSCFLRSNMFSLACSLLPSVLSPGQMLTSVFWEYVRALTLGFFCRAPQHSFSLCPLPNSKAICTFFMFAAAVLHFRYLYWYLMYSFREWITTYFVFFNLCNLRECPSKRKLPVSGALYWSHDISLET